MTNTEKKKTFEHRDWSVDMTTHEEQEMSTTYYCGRWTARKDDQTPRMMAVRGATDIDMDYLETLAKNSLDGLEDDAAETLS